jgi:hypothetical protein
MYLKRRKSLKTSDLLIYFILYLVIARDSPCISTVYYLPCYYKYIMVLNVKKILITSSLCNNMIILLEHLQLAEKKSMMQAIARWLSGFRGAGDPGRRTVTHWDAARQQYMYTIYSCHCRVDDDEDPGAARSRASAREGSCDSASRP